MEIGLIGCGRMGSALLTGIIKSNLTANSNIIVSDPQSEAREQLKKQLEVKAAQSNMDLASRAHTILLAVKPQYLLPVLEEISPALSEKHLIISIAAGIPLEKMEAVTLAQTRIIRAMPNTPALIGLGATAIASGTHASDEDMRRASLLLESVGLVVEVPENLLDAVTGLSGSGPAYVYKFVQALSAQAEKEGMPREQALKLATQTLIGAGKMLESTGMSPGELIDQVTSPGGTTLAGLAAMDEAGFDTATAAAVSAATKRSKELAKNA